jgi:hypothetical protein
MPTSFFLLPDAGASPISMRNRWILPVTWLKRDQQGSSSGFLFLQRRLVAGRAFDYES